MSDEMWVTASRDADAERLERLLTTARLAATPIWPFLAASVSKRDYANRKALASDRIEAVATQMSGGDPVMFGVVHTSLLGQFDADFEILHEARKHEDQVRQRVEAENARRAAKRASHDEALERLRSSTDKGALERTRDQNLRLLKQILPPGTAEQIEEQNQVIEERLRALGARKVAEGLSWKQEGAGGAEGLSYNLFRGETYLGSVDMTDGGWQATLAEDGALGTYGSREEAQAAVEGRLSSTGRRRRTAAEGQVCSVCGDKIAQTDGQWHHDNGEKHDHEAKPGGKESARKVASALYEVRGQDIFVNGRRFGWISSGYPVGGDETLYAYDIYWEPKGFARDVIGRIERQWTGEGRSRVVEVSNNPSAQTPSPWYPTFEDAITWLLSATGVFRPEGPHGADAFNEDNPGFYASRKQAARKTAAFWCPTCGGYGYVHPDQGVSGATVTTGTDGTPWVVCPTCDGQGKIQERLGSVGRKTAAGPVKGIAIYPDKRVEEITVSGLSDMQAVVDGYIEPITLKDGSTLYVNEEYLYRFGSPDFNSIASDVAGLGGRPEFMLRQPILGPALLVGPVDAEGNDTDVTATARRWVQRVAREASLKTAAWACPSCHSTQAHTKGGKTVTAALSAAEPIKCGGCGRVATTATLPGDPYFTGTGVEASKQAAKPAPRVAGEGAQVRDPHNSGLVKDVPVGTVATPTQGYATWTGQIVYDWSVEGLDGDWQLKGTWTEQTTASRKAFQASRSRHPFAREAVVDLDSGQALTSAIYALVNQGGGTAQFRVQGVPYIVYYDQSGSVGDYGQSVSGSVTGDFEVFRGEDAVGAKEVLRQHVSPTGQGSDTVGYAVRRVVEAIVADMRRHTGSKQAQHTGRWLTWVVDPFTPCPQCGAESTRTRIDEDAITTQAHCPACGWQQTNYNHA